MILFFCAIFSFQDKIAKTRYWPVEVFRMAMPSAAKGKKVTQFMLNHDTDV